MTTYTWSCTCGSEWAKAYILSLIELFLPHVTCYNIGFLLLQHLNSRLHQVHLYGRHYISLNSLITLLLIPLVSLFNKPVQCSSRPQFLLHFSRSTHRYYIFSHTATKTKKMLKLYNKHSHFYGMFCAGKWVIIQLIIG